MIKILKSLSITTVLLWGLAGTNAAQAQGMNFEHGSFQEALDKAAAENKMVFLDAYTTWCGPCKAMAKNIFPLESVGKVYNERFVNIKIDMEKGEGIALAKRFKITAYPTMLYLKPSGQEVHRVVGGRDEKGFLEEAQIAMDPTLQIGHLAQQYEAGERDVTFMSNYVKALYNANKREEMLKVGKDYIQSLASIDYHSVAAFTIIAYCGVDYNSAPFNYIVNNQVVLAALEGVGQESVDYVLGNAVGAYVNKVASEGSMAELIKAINETKKAYTSPKQEATEANWYATYYLANKQYDTWFDRQMAAAEKMKEEDPRMADGIFIQTCYRVAMDPTFNDAPQLRGKAIAKINALLEKDPENLAAYYCAAELYKKENQRADALRNVEQFITRSEAKGQPADQRVLQLKADIEALPQS